MQQWKQNLFKGEFEKANILEEDFLAMRSKALPYFKFTTETKIKQFCLIISTVLDTFIYLILFNLYIKPLAYIVMALFYG